MITIIADSGSCWKASPDEPLDLGWDRMCRLMDATKAAGAQVFKPQAYVADLMYPKGTKEHNLLKQYELPSEWLPQIKAECDDRGLEFMATIYHPSHVPLIDPLVSRWKVASFENEHAGLRKAIAATGKPVIVSTGGIDSGRARELELAWYSSVGSSGLTFLHCVSSYPAKPEQMNLRVIGVWNEMYGPTMGLSDHTLGHTAAVMAVALDAPMIEKHIKAADSGNGPDAHFAAGPATFAGYCAKIRLASDMLGDGEKRVMDGEMAQWRWNPETGLRGTA